MSEAAGIDAGGESLGQRLRKRRLPFALLAMWTAAWAALVPLFIQSYRAAFFYDGVTPLSVMRAPGLAQIHSLLGVDLFGAMILAVVAIFFAVLVGLFILEALAWRLRLDVADKTVAAMRWTARALPAVLLLWTMAAMLVVVSIVSVQAFHGQGLVNYVPVGVAAAAWLALTFFALNAAELRRPSPGIFWNAAWPGMQALLVAIAMGGVIAALNWLAGVAVSTESLPTPLTLLIYLVALIASLWPLAAILSLWLNRARWSWLRTDAANVFSRSTLSALLLLDVRMVIWASLVFLVPATITFSMLVLLVPLAEAFNQQEGAGFSALVSACISLARLCQAWWWVLVPIAPTLLLIARGRLFISLGMAPPRP